MNDGPTQDQTPSKESGGSAFSAIAMGLAATLVFMVTAMLLMVIGYSYGVLLEISPEYPFMLSLPFMLGALMVAVVFPLVGMLAIRAELGHVSIRTVMVTGAGFGAASMAIVWLVASRPGTDPSDWPELQYFLQLMLSGAAAGMVLFYGMTSRVKRGFVTSGRQCDNHVSRSGRCGRIILLTLLLFLAVMSVPFLLMWQARRDFNAEARQRASRYFRLPADFSMAITAEGSGVDSLENNVRYKASGVQEEGGRRFSVEVIGERSKYDFAISEISASLLATAADIPAESEWDDSEQGRRTQKAVLDLASACVNSPLEIVSVQPSSSSGKIIVMQGDGLEAVARPGGSSPDDLEVHLTFNARFREPSG